MWPREVVSGPPVLEVSSLLVNDCHLDSCQIGNMHSGKDIVVKLS